VSVIWTPKQLDFKRINKNENFWFLPKEQNGIKETIWQKDVPQLKDKSSFEGDFWVLHHGDSDDLSDLSAASASPPQHAVFLRATARLRTQNWKVWKSLQRITSDKILVKALVDELSRRIPGLHDRRKPPRIVVFTESDTTYCRRIRDELQYRLKVKHVIPEFYSYLRALDGRRDEPRLPGSEDNSKSQEPTASLLQRRAISETSFGTSQFDYLRRTALELKRRANGRQNVVALGVLGSDIYDKMLVLQAVRPVLPDAVFFTTDLDALYLERTKKSFSRNLVVASAADLNVKKNPNALTNRWKIPPMRDSYQTVIVKETRNILRLRNTTKQASKAYIFEIAAGKQVDITRAGAASWPMWWLAQPWFSPVIFVLALLNAFVILWAVTTRVKNTSPPGAMKNWAKWWVYSEITIASTGVLVLLFLLTLWNLIFHRCNSLSGEPLNLGISIWPSVMIRLLALGVAIYLLSRAFYSFVVDGDVERADLKHTLAGSIQFRRRNRGGKAVSTSFPTFQRLFDGARKALAKTIQFRWSLFYRRTLRWRIVKLSIVYLVFSFVLFWIWQPTVPGRGGSALLVEKIVLALGVGLYLVHLIFCFDLHFSSWRLLRAIASHFDRGSPTGTPPSIDLEEMLNSLGLLTTVIGKTLLYPLTVLILIILSRLNIFDNWVMTPSLIITFFLGALVLVAASLFLWAEGAKLKGSVLAQTSLRPAERSSLQAINSGVFAPWYKQPIFAAILSALAVFGSVGIALTRLLSQSN